jgi:hypothetical protein
MVFRDWHDLYLKEDRATPEERREERMPYADVLNDFRLRFCWEEMRGKTD